MTKPAAKKTAGRKAAAGGAQKGAKDAQIVDLKGKDAGAAGARREPGQTQALLHAYGIDKLCEQIVEGKLQREIAREIGVGIASLVEWIAKDEERSRRVKEARRLAARVYVETAEQDIRDAADPFELAKAKELAHHKRWYASKMAPADLGDKLITEHTGEGGGPIKTETVTMTAEEAYKRMLDGQ